VTKISSHHLAMAYKILVSVNNGGKICTPQRFAFRAMQIYLNQVENYPYLLVLLDRALRKLPEVHPDVKRVNRGEYVIKSFEKACEHDQLRRMMRRCGGMYEDAPGSRRSIEWQQKT